MFYRGETKPPYPGEELATSGQSSKHRALVFIPLTGRWNKTCLKSLKKITEVIDFVLCLVCVTGGLIINLYNFF